MGHKCTIALDIDGTLLEKHVPISKKVEDYIKSLQSRGYKICFMTGRTYHFAKKALHVFDFDYFLGVQNGAEVLSMPDHRIFYQKLAPKRTLLKVQKAMKGIQGDYLVYSGYEKGDFCYFRPHNFTNEQLEYLEFLKTLTPTSWIALEHFDAIEQSHFPLIKCLGRDEDMQLVKGRLDKFGSLMVCVMPDRMSDFSILLVTHKNATKGQALKKLKKMGHISAPIIAAGDGMNDISMFDEADICIAMQDSACELIEKADIYAPPASQDGIIQGLQEALKKES